MEPKAFGWLILKKLPIILAVLIAPLTLALVIHFNPSFFEFLRISSPEEPFRSEDYGETKIPESSVEEPDWSQRLDKSADKEKIKRGHRREWNIVKEEDPLLEETVKLSLEEMEARKELCETTEDLLLLATAAQIAGYEDLVGLIHEEALERDPENPKVRKALGFVFFDPLYYLEDFSRYQGQQLEYELKPFRESVGEWITPDRLAEIRELWENTRKRLKEEIERRKLDPHEDLRRRHIRLLMRHDLFAKIISKGNFRFDRSHPPFILFIEQGEEEERRDGLTRFQEVIASDLSEIVKTFLDLYGIHGGKGMDPEPPMFVWMLQAKEEFAAQYFDQDDMVAMKIPEAREGEPPFESERRTVATYLGRMLMDRRLGDGECPLWIQEGLPVLLALGEGEVGKGRLRLNGEGLRESPVFVKWIQSNEGSWPVPLDVLVSLTDSGALWHYCLIQTRRQYPDLKRVPTEDIYEGARVACGLFCRHLFEEMTSEVFLEYVKTRISGKGSRSDLDALLDNQPLSSIQQKIQERFVH